MKKQLLSIIAAGLILGGTSQTLSVAPTKPMTFEEIKNNYAVPLLQYDEPITIPNVGTFRYLIAYDEDPATKLCSVSLFTSRSLPNTENDKFYREEEYIYPTHNECQEKGIAIENEYINRIQNLARALNNQSNTVQR